jgi:nucleoside-diphosphate-sugar epimerase
MKNSNQTILVIGATGNQGGAIARHLLERGKFAVRALVLNENKPAAQALKQSGAELFKGDLNDRASLDSALVFQWFENSGYAADLGELKREFFAPTDLESYLREHGWAKRSASATAGQI